MQSASAAHQRNLKRASGSKRSTLVSWFIALVLFSVIVLLSRTPSGDAPRAVDKTAQAKSQTVQSSSDGDVIVKCNLDTPHDSSAPAHGVLHITVRRSVSPLASRAFLHMVKSEHFNGCYLFRVVKGFIVQWGIETLHSNGRRQKAKFDKVDIDPITVKSLRNVRGSLNFAGGNSASGQVYVNIGNNSHLDKEAGSLPFAMLDEKSMEIIDSVYDGYKAGMGQVKTVEEGADEVKRLFPKMSRIESCWIAKGESIG